MINPSLLFPNFLDYHWHYIDCKLDILYLVDKCIQCKKSVELHGLMLPYNSKQYRFSIGTCENCKIAYWSSTTMDWVLELTDAMLLRTVLNSAYNATFLFRETPNFERLIIKDKTNPDLSARLLFIKDRLTEFNLIET